MNLKPLRFSSLIQFVVVLALAVSAQAKMGDSPRPIDEASKGLPEPAQGPLSPDTFVAVKAKKLANPGLLYLNLDALRELGIEVPPEGATPEFVKSFLNEWAWAIPNKKDNPKQFTNETKTFYADKYGGSGMGYNLGSARAMGAGQFQIKGGGLIEPFIEPQEPLDYSQADSLMKKWKIYWDNAHHSTGKAAVPEAMMEGIWGDTLDRELPYRANRVVAIISTNLSSPVVTGVKEPGAIIIRENSIRPAHFMRNWRGMYEDANKEAERVQAAVTKVGDALPKPDDWKEPKRVDRKMAAQVNEFIDRIGKQFGAEYALSIFHGSTSPSNIELSGKAIDHYNNTAMYGFPKLLNVNDYPSGSTKDLRDYILYEFIEDLAKTLPPEEAKALPDRKEISQRLNSSFNDEIKRKMLWMLGTPEEFVNDAAQSSSGNDLGVILKKIAQAGNDELVHGRAGVPEKNLGTFDFYEILWNLAKNPPDEKRLARLIPEADLRDELLKKFNAYMTTLTGIASKDKVNEAALREYMEFAAPVRARALPELMRTRGNVAKNYLKTYGFEVTGSSKSISGKIERILLETTRRSRNVPPYMLVLQEKHDYQTGNTVRQVYNLKTAQTEILVQTPLTGTKANFFGKEIPIGSLPEATAGFQSRSTLLNGALVSTPKNGDDYASFRFPDPDRTIDLDQSFRVTLDANKGPGPELHIGANSEDQKFTGAGTRAPSKCARRWSLFGRS